MPSVVGQGKIGAVRPRPTTALVGVALLLSTLVVALTESNGLRLTPRGCGPEPTVDVGGAALACTFDDEFDEPALDPAKWQALSTARVGFHSGFECFVDDAQHVRVSGGTLRLTLTAGSPATRCGRAGFRYASGMVTSRGRFAQTYGRFSIRAELPATPGLQPALWLYPQRLRYGPWPASGEIDVAEAFGNTGQTWPHLHYLAPGGVRAHPGTACAATPNRFHTYTVDWTPRGVAFRYDGRLCLRIPRWIPAPPLRAPQPFDQPFFVLLELATGTGLNAPPPVMRLPQSMLVDYVRVWGP